MKLINNRFRVVGILYRGQAKESYIVKDLLENGKIKFLTLYNSRGSREAIEFFAKNFKSLVNIKHNNLVNLEKFDIIESINLKKPNHLMYYVLNEYMDELRLIDMNKNISLKDSIIIILQLMKVIDYIHFRGYTYKHLSPVNIFISEDFNIKIMDLASIYRDYKYAYHNYITELFIAPEIFTTPDELNKYVDYYSIGVIMKYLLFKEFNIEEISKDSFKAEFNLSDDKKVFLLDTIKNLTHKDVAFRNISLQNHINNIMGRFDVDFDNDLKKERDQLFLNTNIIGRDKEINTLLEIDNSLRKGIKEYNGVIINGRSGTGKTKLLNEIAYRFGLLNKSVIYLKGREEITSGGLNISSLLRASIKVAPNELINKYSHDFGELLTQTDEGELRFDTLTNKTYQEKHKIYNCLINYFSDLSKIRPVYILIDDIDISSDDLINFLNHLISRSENKKIFFIATTIDSRLVQNKTISKVLDTLIGEESIFHIDLINLSEADTGKFVKAILGISYIPTRFVSFIYKESLGNPSSIYYVIEDLYHRKELYICEKGTWETIEEDYNKIMISVDENHMINSQLENIEYDKYIVLEIISLSKDMITKDIIKGMLEIDENKLEDIIYSLLESRIIDENLVSNIKSLCIYSTQLKRTVYSRIPCEKRIKLHGQAANCIMRIYNDNYQFTIDELIFHLKNSNQIEYALKLVIAEAEKQDSIYSPYSISLWEHAYNLVRSTDTDEILYILDLLINIYNMKGYIGLTDEYIARMESIAIEKDSMDYLVKAKYYKAEIFINYNQLIEAENLISGIENIIEINKDLYEGQVLLLISKIRLEFAKGRYYNIQELLEEAIEISRKYNVSKHLGSIYNLYGIFYYMIGKPDKATDSYNKSIIAFEQGNNILEGLKPINNIGNIYGNVYGIYDKALEYFKTGYKLATSYDLTKVRLIFTSNIGDVYFRNLQLEEALEYFEDVRNMSNEIGGYKGIILSNLNLGMIYLRVDRYDKVDEVYDFIKKINDKEPIADSEILTTYYNFMGSYYRFYGKFEESLKYYQLLKEVTKDYSSQEYLLAESNIQIIKELVYSDYNRDRIKELIYSNQSNMMTNMELENILIFAMMSVKNGDIDLANEILDIYSKYSNETDESIRAFRDSIDAIISPSSKRLLSLESYLDRSIFNDYKLNIHIILANEWGKLNNYNKAIYHSFKALDNVLKISDTIRDKNLVYNFIKRYDGDMLKSNLKKYIKIKFNKDINYIKLDEVYSSNIDKNRSYNDLVHILNQLDSSEYWEIFNIYNKHEKIESIETLLDKYTSDNQRNLELTLNYLGHETLANRGFILEYNEYKNSYNMVASLVEGDTVIPRENILIQSNKSPVGILINKNLRNMEDSKYIELLPDDAISILCVPLITDVKEQIEVERRKKNSFPQARNLTSYYGSSKIYIYFESNSYLNRFEYDKLLLIKHMTSLILLNAENKYLKDLTIIDELTGVLTRKYFEQQIDNIIEYYNAYQGSFNLLMLDIDNFKGLNDTYGHLIGDDVLSALGKVLKDSVRSTDLVTRFGGDEFIIVLFDTSIEEGINIAEKIRSNTSNIKVSNTNRQVSVSIGLAKYPDHGQTKKELIEKADQALLVGKEKDVKSSLVVWNINMGEGTNSQDKIAGVITGDINKDYLNISAVINTAKLIERKASESEKITEFANMLLDILDAQYSTFIKYEFNGIENVYLYKTKLRNISEWVKTPKLNLDIVQRVIYNKKGEFLIDWDGSVTLNPITEEPIWQSILVLPLIRNDVVLGIIYLSVPLKEKEFTFEDFNLANLLSNIFAAVLDTNLVEDN